MVNHSICSNGSVSDSQDLWMPNRYWNFNSCFPHWSSKNKLYCSPPNTFPQSKKTKRQVHKKKMSAASLTFHPRGSFCEIITILKKGNHGGSWPTWIIQCCWPIKLKLTNESTIICRRQALTGSPGPRGSESDPLGFPRGPWEWAEWGCWKHTASFLGGSAPSPDAAQPPISGGGDRKGLGMHSQEISSKYRGRT